LSGASEAGLSGWFSVPLMKWVSCRRGGAQVGGRPAQRADRGEHVSQLVLPAVGAAGRAALFSNANNGSAEETVHHIR
jgi:hypothetical protein